MVSSMPVTVTVWGVSQLPFVNVRVPVESVDSPVSADERERTTFEFGWASRTTVNVSVDPPSDTPVDPPDSTIVKPATSSSSIVNENTESARGSKLLSEVASITETVTFTL